jgi:hypothetical protein
MKPIISIYLDTRRAKYNTLVAGGAKSKELPTAHTEQTAVTHLDFLMAVWYEH